MNRIALTMAACMLTFAAQAEIYKWRGADGTVQYTSEKPRGVPYEVIEKDPAPRSYDPAVLENSRRQLREANERAQEQKARRELKEKDKDVASKMAKNCSIARENLANLESRPGVLRQDASTGAVVRLTAEEREAAMDRARKDIGYFCGDDASKL